MEKNVFCTKFISLSKGLKLAQIPLGTGGRIFLAKKDAK
jgi:Fe-S cluster biosynthesis and repair protein YggX